MKITFDWLKDHLDTKLNEGKLLEQLTNVGLEVESVENLSAGLDLFKVAKILKTEKHPNADRLKVCDVDVGKNDIIYWKGHVALAISKKKLIHAYGPMKKTVVMGINQTIKRIEQTAKLKVIGIKRL